MESLSVVYGADRRGRPFKFRDAVYAGGWHRGMDVRKQNKDKTASITHDVLAILSGVVVFVGYKTKIGLTVVLNVSGKDVLFESHSHLAEPVVKVGDRVKSGDKLARTAVAGEVTGTSWRGAHDHVVFSRHKDAAWNTARSVIDPAPFIRDALTAVAAEDAVPIVVPPIVLPPSGVEEVDMLFVQMPKGADNGKRTLYAFIAPGFYYEWWGEGAAASFRVKFGEPATVGRTWLDAARREAQAGRTGVSKVEITNADEIGVS